MEPTKFIYGRANKVMKDWLKENPKASNKKQAENYDIAVITSIVDYLQANWEQNEMSKDDNLKNLLAGVDLKV